MLCIGGEVHAGERPPTLLRDAGKHGSCARRAAPTASVACPPPLPPTKAAISFAILSALYFLDASFETDTTIDSFSKFLAA